MSRDKKTFYFELDTSVYTIDNVCMVCDNI